MDYKSPKNLLFNLEFLENIYANLKGKNSELTKLDIDNIYFRLENYNKLSDVSQGKYFD